MALPAENLFSLGELLAKAREDAHLDQSQLAEVIGISRTTLSRWENDKGAPTVPQFRAIALATEANWLWSQFSSKLTPVDMPAGQMELALDERTPWANAI